LRSLSGKLRIGLAEQSALTALAHALTITPPLIRPDEEQIIDYFSEKKINQTEQIKKQCEESSKLLKFSYYQCPNYEVVIKAILGHGLDKLNDNCKLTPGIPLKPMLAYPTNGISEVLRRFEDIEFTCEYKYDGERAQVCFIYKKF
jgi:DNA ligase-1